jgi:hypothetical protein
VSEIVNDQVNQLGLGSSPAPDGFVTHATLTGILNERDAGLRGFVSSEVGKVLAILVPSTQPGGVGTRRNLAADPSFRRDPATSHQKSRQHWKSQWVSNIVRPLVN